MSLFRKNSIDSTNYDINKKNLKNSKQNQQIQSLIHTNPLNTFSTSSLNQSKLNDNFLTNIQNQKNFLSNFQKINNNNQYFNRKIITNDDHKNDRNFHKIFSSSLIDKFLMSNYKPLTNILSNQIISLNTDDEKKLPSPLLNQSRTPPRFTSTAISSSCHFSAANFNLQNVKPSIESPDNNKFSTSFSNQNYNENKFKKISENSSLLNNFDYTNNNSAIDLSKKSCDEFSIIKNVDSHQSKAPHQRNTNDDIIQQGQNNEIKKQHFFIDLQKVKPITSTYLKMTRSMGLSDEDALKFDGLVSKDFKYTL